MSSKIDSEKDTFQERIMDGRYEFIPNSIKDLKELDNQDRYLAIMSIPITDDSSHPCKLASFICSFIDQDDCEEYDDNMAMSEFYPSSIINGLLPENYFMDDMHEIYNTFESYGDLYNYAIKEGINLLQKDDKNVTIYYDKYTDDVLFN